MNTWSERKTVGDQHEQRVAVELRSRGWEVAPWGQGMLPDAIRQAASRTTWANCPDLIAARDGDLVTIDCKDRMSSSETGRYAIARKCVSFGLQFVASFGIPTFYVFGNLGVLTPWEVMAYGSVGPRGLGGSYYLVNGRLAHQFDDVFGAPTVHDTAA
jgi:Holliday junction resolvase